MVLVTAGSFIAIRLLGQPDDGDPCTIDGRRDAFSVCRSWTDSGVVVLIVSLAVGAVAGLVVWSLAALQSRQRARDARWAEPNPGNWHDPAESA